MTPLSDLLSSLWLSLSFYLLALPLARAPPLASVYLSEGVSVPGKCVFQGAHKGKATMESEGMEDSRASVSSSAGGSTRDELLSFGASLLQQSRDRKLSKKKKKKNKKKEKSKKDEGDASADNASMSQQPTAEQSTYRIYTLCPFTSDKRKGDSEKERPFVFHLSFSLSITSLSFSPPLPSFPYVSVQSLQRAICLERGK